MSRTVAGLSRHVTRKALDASFRAVRTRAGRRDAREPKGLVGRTVVILLEGLGDSLAFTPALRALRRTFPGTRIDLLVNDVSYEVYRTWFEADRFLLWRRRRLGGAGFLSLLGTLRANRYGTAITPSLLFRHTVLTYLAGAPLRVGFDVNGRGAPLNLALPLDREKPRIHCYLDLMEALGAAPDGDRMELEPTAEDERRASALLGRAAGLGGGGPVVMIHPGTKQEVNRWPPERYAMLADRLGEEFGAAVAFTGGRGDRPLVEQIRSVMREQALSLAGATSLRELAALLTRCDLFVCPDTGAMHVGSAAGVPMVVLMGGRNRPREWMPLSRTAYVIRREVSCSPCRQPVCREGDVRCMKAIALDDVMEGVRALLGRGVSESDRTAVRVSL